MLIWNVFNYDIGKKTIEVRNVFNLSCKFIDGLKKVYKKYSRNRVSFEEGVKDELLSAYWSKCEYEVIITSWPPYIAKAEADRIKTIDVKYREAVDLTIENKIDVYEQVMVNWEQFIDYLWKNRKLIKEL